MRDEGRARLWRGADETGKDNQEIIVAFKACFPGDAGPPASDAASCGHTPQDSD